MKLKTRLLSLYALSTLVLMIATGWIYYAVIWNEELSSIREDVARQMRQIDFSLNSFFADVENDVAALALDETVRQRDDRDFTNFLNADEQSFHYRIGTLEQKIINILNTYRLTHPSVNSVYMGRAIGAFVRSHPREQPTRYDPRERPWYRLAAAHPGNTVKTEAYASLTAPDVNIGVARALVDDEGAVFGVVGADVTLRALTDYIGTFTTDPRGTILLLNGAGAIMAGGPPAWRLKNISEYLSDLPTGFPESGPEASPVVVHVGDNYVFYHASLVQNWKLLVLIPAANIETPIFARVIPTVAVLPAGFILLSLLTVLWLNRWVLNPLEKLAGEAEYISRTSDLTRRIGGASHDEIDDLAGSFNTMMDSLARADIDLRRSEKEHQERLEAEVKERTAELVEANKKLSAEVIRRTAIEHTLAQSEAKYRDLVENVNSVILRWTKEGVITFANAFAERFYGFQKDELLGRPVVGSIVPERDSDGRDLSSLMRDIFSDPEAYALSENENVKKNGEKVWVSWTNRPITNERGEAVEILSVGSDVTDRKRAEERLRLTLAELKASKERAEAADRLKSAFLATMSHELRTPLNSIIGFTGVLLQGMVGPLNAEQEKQLGMVRESARHLLALINDVLDISKIEAGQLRMANEEFDLRPIIEKAIGSARPLADKKGLALTADVPSAVPAVRGDSRRAEQVLINLIGNAVKFTEQGSVGVQCLREKGSVAVRVIDTGIGIKPEDIDALFRPFSQVDTGLSRRYEGTGLGLSICKRLVTLMGGTMEVSSRWGTGSCFSFTLPAAEEP
ncbi:MAG: PAS domain S-box protein [Spirochaetales bacterium]|nr:PAS domain S-box protein [Spirochaetales bacterium]